ncbi:MAG: hypothetical protein IT343_21945 [Candidatus Melainabacteria bacterium]|jgi:hypothetical protein|nr:hypothetical protein [Candidatus Melainabacteria bacterium]
MKSYLIKSLTDEQLGLLTTAGVQFYPWQDGGIMIEETQLELLLEALNATATRGKASYQGVYKLKLTFKKSKKNKNGMGEQPGDKEAEEEAKERARKLEKERQESRRRYIKACESRTKEFLDGATRVAGDYRKKLTGLKWRFVRTKRDEVFQGQVEGNEAAARHILAELERVRMVRGVQAVHVVPNRMLIATDILCATDPETGFRHAIGQFLITVYLDGSNEGIRWQNNSRRVDAVREKMQAPTVFSDGLGASSEIHATMLELIARMEFSTVAELAIQFIENPEDNEYGKHVNKWPLV